MGRTSDTRQRLMQAAHELIWNYSYSSVTIEVICERAGVKKGSFYYFFDSKVDLAIAAIEAWWVERRAQVTEIFHPNVPPLARIRGYIDMVAKSQLEFHARQGRVLGCPLFTLGAEICHQDEKLRSLVQGIMNNLGFHLERALVEAENLGQLEKGRSKLNLRLLWSFYEGTLTRARIENDPELLRHLSADALEVIGARPALADVA